MSATPEAPRPNPYARLPEPIPVEEMITSQPDGDPPAEKNDELREVEWLIRTAGL